MRIHRTAVPAPSGSPQGHRASPATDAQAYQAPSVCAGVGMGGLYIKIMLQYDLGKQKKGW